jgi:hypothetical protein
MSTFFIGDSDLRLLGACAALAARYQARRKSGITRDLDGFAQNDKEALAMFMEGVTMGSQVPADDVPEIRITVDDDGPDAGFVVQLRNLIVRLQADEHDEEGDDDEPWIEQEEA